MAAQVVVAAGYSSVTATVLPADGSVPSPDGVAMALDASGTATTALDVSGVPPGPFTVEFAATGGPGGPAVPATVYFQLYRSGSGPARTSPRAQGREAALWPMRKSSTSRSRSPGSGRDTDYAAAKPVWDRAGLR